MREEKREKRSQERMNRSRMNTIDRMNQERLERMDEWMNEVVEEEEKRRRRQQASKSGWWVGWLANIDRSNKPSRAKQGWRKNERTNEG